jgi:hypothetical protein
MPNLEINIYLLNGGKATVKIEGTNQSASALNVLLHGLLAQTVEPFRFNEGKAFIQLKRSEIIGFSVDEF